MDEREQMNRGFFAVVPHNNALGMEVLTLGPTTAVMRLPWAEHLVGNPDTGSLHGGAVSALIDATCGAAVFQSLREPVPIATLDLRIDYQGLGVPGRALLATADCYRVTRQVAFVRCETRVEGEGGALVATGAGAFMIGTRRGSRAPAGESPWSEG